MYRVELYARLRRFAVVTRGRQREPPQKSAPREAGRKCGASRERRQAQGREGEW